MCGLLATLWWGHLRLSGFFVFPDTTHCCFSYRNKQLGLPFHSGMPPEVAAHTVLGNPRRGLAPTTSELAGCAPTKATGAWAHLHGPPDNADKDYALKLKRKQIVNLKS